MYVRRQTQENVVDDDTGSSSLSLCGRQASSEMAHIRFQTMVLAFKPVSRTTPIYLQTLVRPHGPERALHSATSAGRLVPPSLRANKSRSEKSQLFFLSASGGINSRPVSGQQSHSLSSALDSRLHLDTERDSLLPPHPYIIMHLYVRIISTSITALMH